MTTSVEVTLAALVVSIVSTDLTGLSSPENEDESKSEGVGEKFPDTELVVTSTTPTLLVTTTALDVFTLYIDVPHVRPLFSASVPVTTVENQAGTSGTTAPFQTATVA
jgi:hypothetical protein